MQLVPYQRLHQQRIKQAMMMSEDLWPGVGEEAHAVTSLLVPCQHYQRLPTKGHLPPSLLITIILVDLWTGVGEEEEHQHYYQRLPTNCYLPPNIQIIIIILVDVTKQGHLLSILQISVDVSCQGHRELHVIQEIPSALANHAL